MIIFYLFPFFVNTVLKRFRIQFEPKENGWLYVPEHKARTEILTQDEYHTYQKIFKEKLITNAVIATLSLVALAYWIFFIRITFGYYLFGLMIGIIIYQDAYTDMVSQYYNPHKKKKFRYFLVGIGAVAFLGYCNYRDWVITKEDTQRQIAKFLDYVGLTPIIEQYPYIVFGVIILLGAAYSMVFGRMSFWFRPTTKKQRQKVVEERNVPPKEKPWDKEMRENLERAKKKKKAKKKAKKKRRKENGKE